MSKNRNKAAQGYMDLFFQVCVGFMQCRLKIVLFCSLCLLHSFFSPVTLSFSGHGQSEWTKLFKKIFFIHLPLFIQVILLRQGVSLPRETDTTISYKQATHSWYYHLKFTSTKSTLKCTIYLFEIVLNTILPHYKLTS